MSGDGILKEFDPLAGSEETTKLTSRPNNKELVCGSEAAASSNTSVLDEFDPLAQEKEAEDKNAGHSLSPLPSVSGSSIKYPLTVTSQASELPSKVNQFNQAYSNEIQKSHLRVLPPTSEAISQSNGASDQRRLDQIGAEIGQIDSVLKALNMGQLDITSLTATPIMQPVQSSQSNQAKQVKVHKSCSSHVLRPLPFP